MSTGACPCSIRSRRPCCRSTSMPGFSLVKLGEEAWVDLAKFTLDGGEGRKLRQTKSKAERSGATLEFVPAEKVDKLIPQLERVSNAWIEERANVRRASRSASGRRPISTAATWRSSGTRVASWRSPTSGPPDRRRNSPST